MTTFDERLVIDSIKEGNIIYNEHLVRYQFASQFTKGKIVLDIACGSGYGSKMLAEAGAAKVIAMDVSEEAIESARKNFPHNNIEHRAGDALKIALGEKTVDAVVSFETIEHLKDADAYLQELARVVKDDGLVMISTPNRKVSQEKNPFHFKEFDKEEFEAILKKYFPYCLIVSQYNALASFLKINGSEAGRVTATNDGEPIFFLAVCSKSELPVLPIDNLASLNVKALENIYNNPGLKLADRVYSLSVRIPGMKKLFALLK